MKLTYAWRIESLFPDIDPNVIGNRLSELEAHHGFLSKSIIVEEGKSTRSPLYPLFERNAQTALERWNQQKARQIISALVLVKNGKKMRKTAFVYVDAPQSTRKAYVSLVVAMRSPSLREQIVERGVKEYLAWVQRYGALPEFKAMRPTIRSLKSKIESQLLLNID